MLRAFSRYRCLHFLEVYPSRSLTRMSKRSAIICTPQSLLSTFSFDNAISPFPPPSSQGKTMSRVKSNSDGPPLARSPWTLLKGNFLSEKLVLFSCRSVPASQVREHSPFRNAICPGFLRITETCSGIFASSYLGEPR